MVAFIICLMLAEGVLEPYFLEQAISFMVCQGVLGVATIFKILSWLGMSRLDAFQQFRQGKV